MRPDCSVGAGCYVSSDVTAGLLEEARFLGSSQL